MSQKQSTPSAPTFDLVTHKRDKFGKIIEINPYRLHCIKDQKGFERPINSGNLWYENNQPMGRLKKDEKGNLAFDIGAPHVEYVAPLNADQQAAREAGELKARNAALEAELAQLRSEAKAKADAASAEAAKTSNKQVTK